jgi:trehalose-phosphatase
VSRFDALAGVPSGLWTAARAAERRLLVLDFDGTLAPFTREPAAARPRPRTRAALGRIVLAGRSRVAIVSGRPPSELVSALGAVPIAMVGEHGWTVRSPDGEVREHPLEARVAARLATAADAVALAVPLARIERKRASIVVHTRGLDPEVGIVVEERAADLLRPPLGDARLELRSIHGGLELRARGHDKGSAVAALVAELGPGTLPVVVGDDESDEDSFRAAEALGGWAVLVGRPRPTLALARVDSPDNVAELLTAWLERVDMQGTVEVPQAPAAAR